MRQAQDGRRRIPEQSLAAEAAEEVYWPLIPVSVRYGQMAGAKGCCGHASTGHKSWVARPSHGGLKESSGGTSVPIPSFNLV